MSTLRHRNQDWQLPEKMTWELVAVALLLDIRGELRTIRSLAQCYRVPRALDALIEQGAEARRKKRAAAKRRKAKS
jgi:hypothetical protein